MLDHNCELRGSGRISVATACSGSEMPMAILRIIEKAMTKINSKNGNNNVNLDFSFDHVFSCEINAAKAQWCQAFHKGKSCVFKDIGDPKHDTAPC